MTFRRVPLVTVLALAGLVALPDTADAQLGKRLRERAKAAAEQRAERRAEQAVNAALDRTEDAITCVVTDEACLAEAKQEGKQVVVTDSAGTVIPAAGNSGAAGQRPGEGAWANFDFVPGDRALFVEDFATVRVGNFPQRLEWRSGNLEIVEWQGGRYLRSAEEGSFDVILPEALPERFTIEYDLYDPLFWPSYIYSVDSTRNADKHTRAFFSFNGESGLVTGPPSLSTAPKSAAEVAPNQAVMRVSIIADGRYVKVFLDEKRISNMPAADFPRTNRLRFDTPAGNAAGDAVLIGNIRVAAGSTSLYDALQADGQVSTQGILFDLGSDRIRAESTPTLSEIGRMLTQHADLRLAIEGHTDATGNAASNQTLSARRAEAVRQYLIDSYSVDASRLQAVGKGQSEPAASNDTPEGRQNNRRVVLVRQ